MVCFSVEHHPTGMAKSVTHTKKPQPNYPNQLNIPACEQYQSAMVDLIILIAVISASGFLLYPYFKLLLFEFLEIFGAISVVFKEEVSSAPMIYGCLGISIFCGLLSVLAITICTSKKCGKPGCREPHKAAEFDFQLETEECERNSASNNSVGVEPQIERTTKADDLIALLQ